MPTIQTNALRGKAIFGPKVDGPSPGGHPHHNHIYEGTTDTTVVGVQLDVHNLSWQSGNQTKLKFTFDSHSEYVTDPHVFMESPAQQFLRLDLPGAWNGSYDTTRPADEKLKSADNVNSSTAPWPGVGSQFRRHSGGSSLYIPTAKSGMQLLAQTPLVPAPFTFTFLKRSYPYTSPSHE